MTVCKKQLIHLSSNMVMPSPSSVQEAFPASIWKFLTFQFFNFAGIPLFVGVPMLLFVRQLNGTDTVLGVMAAIPTLAVLLQIPAASLIPQFGYKKMLTCAWVISLIAGFLIIGIPLLPGTIDDGAKIALLIISLSVMHGVRAGGATGVWAWMMQLMPEKMRGKVLSREQIVAASANIMVMFGFAIVIPENPSLAFFSVVFAVGWLMFFFSLQAARKIPDVPVAEAPVNQTPIPWRAMIQYPPFLRLISFSMVFFFAFSAMCIFWLPLLRDVIGAGDSMILVVVGSGGFFSIISMLILGKIIDQTGSRPIMHFTVSIIAIHCLIWFALAAKTIPFNFWSMLAITATSGFAVSGFSMSLIRLLMKTVPEMGRSHFFAIFNVLNNVMMGVMPVLWGMMLDGLGSWKYDGVWFVWNRYSLLYFLLAVIFFLSLFLIRRLDEDLAMKEDDFFNQMVMRTPVRAWTRLNDWIFSRIQ